MKPTDEQLADLARLLGDTAETEIDCEGVLDRVSAYLKALTDRRALDRHLGEVAQHLRVCPECREEFVALIRAEGLDPRTVLGETD